MAKTEREGESSSAGKKRLKGGCLSSAHHPQLLLHNLWPCYCNQKFFFFILFTYLFLEGRGWWRGFTVEAVLSQHKRFPANPGLFMWNEILLWCPPGEKAHTHTQTTHTQSCGRRRRRKKPLYTCSTASQTSLSSLLMNVNKSIMHRRIHAVNQAKARDSVFVHRLLLVKLIGHHIFCFQKATDSKLWQHNETRGLIDSIQTWLLLPGGQDGKFHREFGQIWKFHYSVMYGIEMFMTCLCFHSWSFALVPCTLSGDYYQPLLAISNHV